MRSNDAAIVVGGGVAFGPPRKNFAVELRFAQGLLDVIDDQPDQEQAKNRVFLVVASYEL